MLDLQAKGSGLINVCVRGHWGARPVSSSGRSNGVLKRLWRTKIVTFVCGRSGRSVNEKCICFM